MSEHISVIGAGISGPTAALSLIRAGYDVTLYERRMPQDLHSYGVIGITPENVVTLTSAGVDLRSVELDNSYTDWTPNGVTTSRWNGSYVMWTDIHRVILDAALDAGANVKFGTSYDDANEGTCVYATGVGYAAWRGLTANYAYSVYRGLSRFDTQFAWLAYNDPEKRFAFKLAHSPIGASWEMYVHRTNPAMRSIQSMDLPAEKEFLPEEFQTIVNGTREMAIAPISDWDIARVTSDYKTYTIGDANGGMRPHTGMGANLGINEAFKLPEIMKEKNGSVIESLYKKRLFQHNRGAEMGTALLGN